MTDRRCELCGSEYTSWSAVIACEEACETEQRNARHIPTSRDTGLVKAQPE